MTGESGIVELDRLLAGMDPVIEAGRWVFVSLPGAAYGDGRDWQPLAAVREDEGLTLVLELGRAEALGLSFDGVFRSLLLRVHSSLQAVGLTAAVSTVLADHGIAANMVSGTFHDRVLVPEASAETALTLLQKLRVGPGSK